MMAMVGAKWQFYLRLNIKRFYFCDDIKCEFELKEVQVN